MRAQCLALAALTLIPVASRGALRPAPLTRAPSTGEVRLPPIRHATLDNGLRIVLMAHHRAPVLELIAVAAGGSSQDPPGKAGTASLTAELLRRGTTMRDAVQLADEIDSLGGSLDGAGGPDSVRVAVSGLAKDADRWLDLLADVVRNPTFPADELDRERRLRLDALRALPEDPAALAERAATRVVFNGHPYGILETEASLNAITRDDLAAYHRAYIAPQNLAIVAVGDFSTDAMLAKLRDRFADWPRGAAPRAAAPPVPEGRRRIVIVDKPDAEQTHLRFVRPGIARTSARLPAARVASAALGGGFTSRLVQEVRVRRSLTYGVWSAVQPRRTSGDVEIGTFTKVPTARQTADVVAATAARAARSGLTAAELRKVQGYLTGLFAIEAQTPAALAARLADAATHGLPDAEVIRYIAHVRSVTLTEANRAARDLFNPRGMSLVFVGPAEKLRGQVAGLGKVEDWSVEDVLH